jgi:GNAT superfamily N-acetyltransferase
MTMEISNGVAYQVRPYEGKDQAAVLDLLRASLGDGPTGERSPKFFRWKHLENPFGRSYMLVAEQDGWIIGLRAFMRWRLRGERMVRAVRAVDTATHPDHQGKGVFRSLTLRAVEELRDETDVVFNTPNQNSLPGYLKMGWRILGQVPVDVRVRRPARFARHLGSVKDSSVPARAGPPVAAPAAGEALHAEGLSLLLEEADRPDGRLVTPRDLTFLWWRYGDAPLGYHAVIEEEAGAVTGLGIFRVRPRGRLWEATLAELIVRPGDRTTAARVLGRVVHAAAVDHVTCVFPAGSAAAGAARRRGFFPSRQGITVVVNPLAGITPDPRHLDSWAFSLGDLEVL